MKEYGWIPAKACVNAWAFFLRNAERPAAGCAVTSDAAGLLFGVL